MDVCQHFRFNYTRYFCFSLEISFGSICSLGFVRVLHGIKQRCASPGLAAFPLHGFGFAREHIASQWEWYPSMVIFLFNCLFIFIFSSKSFISCFFRLQYCKLKDDLLLFPAIWLTGLFYFNVSVGTILLYLRTQWVVSLFFFYFVFFSLLHNYTGLVLFPCFAPSVSEILWILFQSSCPWDLLFFSLLHYNSQNHCVVYESTLERSWCWLSLLIAKHFQQFGFHYRIIQDIPILHPFFCDRYTSHMMYEFRS